MKIITCSDMKDLEAKADAAGLSYYQMMENAGMCATMLVMGSSGHTLLGGGHAVIFCGKGNNGGDGLVVARRLASYGNKVTVVLTDGKPVSGDAKKNYQLIKDEENVTITEELPGLDDADVVVDAIYGTGFHGELREDIVAVINAINNIKENGKPVIALDLPSGLPGDIDEYDAIGLSVHASHTVAFHCCKQIHNNKPAARVLGKVSVADIGINDALKK